MKHPLLLLFVSFLFFSFEKDENQLKQKNENKKHRNAPECTKLLIPSSITCRIGFIEDGMVPLPINNYLNTNRILHGFGTIQPFLYNIYNPSLFGGLNNEISGPRLTGLANDFNTNDILLSYSNQFDHFLFTAGLVGFDYIINNSLTLNAPFAPANQNWVLHDIEMSNLGELYGIFYNENTNTSIVSEIDINTGICTSIFTLTSTRLAGLEVMNNKIYLLHYTLINPSLYGVVYQYSTLGLYQTTYNLNLPTTSLNSTSNLNPLSLNYSHEYFLSFKPSTWSLYLYNGAGSDSKLYLFRDVNTPTPPANVVTNLRYYYDNVYLPPLILNGLITDSSN